MSTSNGVPKRNESDVYDRQIRLWGAEAQAKISKSKVLYIHVTGLSSEILKNLVLAGVRATLCDGRPYPDAMKETPSFFLTRDDFEVDEKDVKRTKRTVADALKPKIEELNPLLGECETYTTDPSNLTADFIQQFSIIVASHISMSDAIRIAEATVKNGGKFFMADSFGFDAASVLDLGAQHTFRPERGKTLLDETTLSHYIPLMRALLDVPLSDTVNRFHKTPIPVWIRYRCILEYVEQKKVWPSILSVEDFVETVTKWIKERSPNLVDHIDLQPKALERLAKVASSELAPVCSVLGGMLGTEVIKAISGKGEPANNTILFDGASCKAFTFLVGPKEF